MTTSWDDGHPLDWRLAELLAKYDLPGTFYIPRRSQRPTMTEAEVRKLSTTYDVGGHTLDHLALTTLDALSATQQVRGCKAWLEDTTGRPCPAFCPPLGKFNRDNLQLIQDAGFTSVRTVELASLDRPRAEGKLLILPTTVQAFPHGRLAYAKNAIRRRSLPNFLRSAISARGHDWVGFCARLVKQASRRGGVVHLWGHSWEIEETGQWTQLEEALRLLASLNASRVSNAELALTHRI